jgi:dTDP-4-dehydrorhamnose reductase
VVPVTTEEYGLSAARRPLNSRLDTSGIAEAGLKPLPHWRDALRRHLMDIGCLAE